MGRTDVPDDPQKAVHILEEGIAADARAKEMPKLMCVG